jgi:hypothetical protein
MGSFSKYVRVKVLGRKKSKAETKITTAQII